MRLWRSAWTRWSPLAGAAGPHAWPARDGLRRRRRGPGMPAQPPPTAATPTCGTGDGTFAADGRRAATPRRARDPAAPVQAAEPAAAQQVQVQKPGCLPFASGTLPTVKSPTLALSRAPSCGTPACPTEPTGRVEPARRRDPNRGSAGGGLRAFPGDLHQQPIPSAWCTSTAMTKAPDQDARLRPAPGPDAVLGRQGRTGTP